MKITGIIIAGGKSSRMGTNKALLKIDGQTVIEKIVLQLKQIVSEIILVTNTFDEYRFLGLPMVEDQWKDIGPLAGIHTGLNFSKTEKNLIVACDMPFISSRLGAVLLEKLDTYQAVVPKVDGRLQPLFAAYRKDIEGEIQRSIKQGNHTIRSFFQYIHGYYMNEQEIERLGFSDVKAFFFNMNDRKEFNEALRMAAKRVNRIE